MNSRRKVGLNGLLSGFLAKTRKEAALPFLKNRKSILDIGCGVFIWNNSLPQGCRYIGIDNDPSIIDYNTRSTPHEFKVADFERDSFDQYDRFDAIVCLAALEHFSNPFRALAKMRALLNPGGIIVATTPHPQGRAIMEIGARIKIFSNDKDEHETLFRKVDLEAIANDADLILTEYKRFLIGYNQVVVLQSKL
jgi:2-polyprenyl-3-methyl-5-hydroxy-6-metoxy-1,4-benzoquinol methylase